MGKRGLRGTDNQFEVGDRVHNSHPQVMVATVVEIIDRMNMKIKEEGSGKVYPVNCQGWFYYPTEEQIQERAAIERQKFRESLKAGT